MAGEIGMPTHDDHAHPKIWLGIINTEKTLAGTHDSGGNVVYKWNGVNPKLLQRLTLNSYLNWAQLYPVDLGTSSEWCVYQRYDYDSWTDDGTFPEE